MKPDNEAVDLTAFLPQDVSVLDILKPGGTEPTGWKITLAGPSHPQTIAWSNELSRKNIERDKKIEISRVNGRKYKGDDQSPEDVRLENVRNVVSRIVSWSPIRIGDETMDFSPDRATELLLRPTMGWAYVQIVEYLGDEKSFTKASAKP